MRILLVTLIATLSTLTAQAGVEYLGQTTLGQFKDYDVVHVGQCPTFNNKPIYSLKLQVARKGAEINYLKVYYGNGAPDVLNVKQFFQPGSDSRWMDLNGTYRCIDKIVIVGDTQKLIPIGQRSVVRFWGMR